MISKALILSHAISVFKSIGSFSKKDSTKKAVSNIKDSISKENTKAKGLFRTLISYPFKTIALFILAPFFLLKVILKVKNRWRKFIAILGLIVSVIVSYVAGTFLGSTAGSIFVIYNIGLWYGLAFFVGTLTSSVITVAFMILLFNLISTVFLKISTSEVVEYLEEMTD